MFLEFVVTLEDLLLTFKLFYFQNVILMINSLL